MDVATLGDLIRAYKASPAWDEKAPSTRQQYQKAFDYLAQIDATPLAQIDSPWTIRLRDIVHKQRQRRFANLILQIISLLWNWGRPYGYTPDDAHPTKTVPKVRRPRGLPQANRPWTLDEFHAFLDAAPPALRVGAALGGYAGLRESDILRADWTWWDGQNLVGRAQKTGEIIDVRAHIELRSILNDERRRRNVAPGSSSPLVQSSRTGEAFTESGFRASFFKLVKKLEAAGTVKPGLTVHGLRHTVATNLADAGCTTREIMAVTGHKTEAMVALYTDGADRRRSADAAIDRMEALTKRRLK
jgi:integrase